MTRLSRRSSGPSIESPDLGSTAELVTCKCSGHSCTKSFYRPFAHVVLRVPKPERQLPFSQRLTRA